MSFQTPENPLTDREQRIIDARRAIDDECPNPECDLSVHVVSLTNDGHLYVSHEEDGVGMDSRTPRGETDGCRIQPTNDPTL